MGDEPTELAASGIILYVDGASKALAYDTDTDHLSRTTGRLSHGKHRAKAVAEDAAGDRAAKTRSFRVIRGR